MVAAYEVLGEAVATLGDNAQFVAGKLLVLETALLALVQTHPDPAAFSAQFRRTWQLAGSQHSNSEHGPQNLAGIEQMMELLEEVCPGFGVRPGR